jgi:hypothetical protein
MRAAARRKYELAGIGCLEEQKQAIIKSPEPLYWQIALTPSVRQDGINFAHLVAPFRVKQTVPELKMEQSGAGVFCQTEVESKETFDNLTARNTKHLVSFHSGKLGGVGWVTNFRRLCSEIKVMLRNLADGKILWLAIDREIDLDTLEATVIRRRETNSEGEANFWAGKWLDELNKEKKSYFDSISQIVTPPPPQHCTALTPSEIESIGKAKMVAIQR